MMNPVTAACGGGSAMSGGFVKKQILAARFGSEWVFCFGFKNLGVEESSFSRGFKMRSTNLGFLGYGFPKKLLLPQPQPNASAGVRRTGGIKPRSPIVIPEVPEVEKGKYSYDVESAINHLSSLAPRGSIAKCMEGFRSKLSMHDFSLIFREFAQRGDWQKALRLFKYMQRHQWCKPKEHVYTIMIGDLLPFPFFQLLVTFCKGLGFRVCQPGIVNWQLEVGVSHCLLVSCRHHGAGGHA
jgi:pentatricopeptide repeat protein